MQSARSLLAASFFQSRPVDLPPGRGSFFAGFQVGRGITATGKAMKRCLDQKINMKTKVLLLGAVVTAFTLTSFAADALLSPRAQASQIKVVKGVVSERNPYVECRNEMTGSSPKAITTCIQTMNLSGCVVVAMQK
jgi:hypothetical protein